jgi:hypothetical protein
MARVVHIPADALLQFRTVSAPPLTQTQGVDEVWLVLPQNVEKYDIKIEYVSRSVSADLHVGNASNVLRIVSFANDPVERPILFDGYYTITVKEIQ